ncbi:hypothetical protein [Agromyces bauzanensis]|uniref:Uncharacterized protein n=1 Tax=Agromyces bauzanensis TaxID=1308924 RepID=A0A917PVN8_9MICO|nr:hypothetical protein [Agromyces bauzanensis]GGJ94040.1 hypothetical protein GCM10011372_35490 [Agromyces bauzanensis]
MTVLGAFAFGALIDRIGGGTSINLLAPAAPVCRCIAVPSGRSALLRLPTSRAG